MSTISVPVPGFVLPGFTVRFTREMLVCYAGAATDFNPIHTSDAAAQRLGLPGVIAHGMLTMGTALRVVTDWVGDPARIISYSVRFSKPVVVDPKKGTQVAFSGKVEAVADGIATCSLVAEVSGEKVLGAAKAEVWIG